MTTDKMRICPTCDGKGQVCVCGRPAGHPRTDRCPTPCARTCPDCHGAGLMLASRIKDAKTQSTH